MFTVAAKLKALATHPVCRELPLRIKGFDNIFSESIPYPLYVILLLRKCDYSLFAYLSLFLLIVYELSGV